MSHATQASLCLVQEFSTCSMCTTNPLRGTQNLSGGMLQATLLLDHMLIHLKMGSRVYNKCLFLFKGVQHLKKNENSWFSE